MRNLTVRLVDKDDSPVSGVWVMILIHRIDRDTFQSHMTDQTGNDGISRRLERGEPSLVRKANITTATGILLLSRLGRCLGDRYRWSLAG